MAGSLTDNALECFSMGYSIGDDESKKMMVEKEEYYNCIVVNYNQESEIFKCIGLEQGIEIEEVSIGTDSLYYLPLLKLNIAFGIEGDTRAAMLELLDSIDCPFPHHLIQVEVFDA